MPKLKRQSEADNRGATDFIESLDRGLRVPEDVAVVGFDDPPWAQALRPTLTAIRQPTREMGELAVALLLQRLSAPRSPIQRLELAPDLMIRGSS